MNRDQPPQPTPRELGRRLPDPIADVRPEGKLLRVLRDLERAAEDADRSG